MPESQALFDRALAVTPGGVNSPVRAFNAVGGTPRFIASAQGAWLTDVDGRRYVDLICSWGPMLLGHAHPEVQAEVQAAVARGTSYGTPTQPEVELAEEIVARTPVERVRFVSSGTEATMSAIRLARGFTGRDVVVKFAGCYHGHVDSLLASAGSGLATFAVPGTPGVPVSSTELTLVLPYNDRAAVEKAFAEHGDRIACLITEASPGNMGVVPPEAGFNAFLAETCRSHGALFISDEVMTGFRVTRQGQWGLDGSVEGWRPDLFTFGKVMGGGFPMAAFGGRADVMSVVAPLGPVYQAGTLSGNPVAVQSGLGFLSSTRVDGRYALRQGKAGEGGIDTGVFIMGRVGRHGHEFGAGLGTSLAEFRDCLRCVQPRIESEAVPGLERGGQPLFRRRIGQRFDAPAAGVDLLRGL